MTALVFHPVSGKPAPRLGIAYRRTPTDQAYLRFTHIFKECYYVIDVTTVEAVRHARKPYRLTVEELESLLVADGDGGCFGQLDLPASMQWRPDPKTDAHVLHELRVKAIAPLVKLFNDETNLKRSQFDRSIRERAAQVKVSFDTVKRDLLRYYYFGLDERSLVPLPSGTKPTVPRSMKVLDRNAPPPTRARRGPTPVESPELTKSTFVPSEADIAEMRLAVRAMRKQMPTATWADCRDHYLLTFFAVSHPDLMRDWDAELTADHVTVRMLMYYMAGQELSTEEKRDASKAAKGKRTTGALRSSGPGSIYEADATGGRIVIVSEPKFEDEAVIELGQPTMYFIIDRWSRFVVSAYITLGTNSAEELRHSLMLAFGPREAPLRRFGVIASEATWPRGQVCSVMATDRGSDYLAEATGKAVADSLRIHHRVLSAMSPEKKGIVERFNATAKKFMHQRLNRRGSYAKRPTDPHTRRAMRQAKEDSQATMKVAWEALIEAVTWYNNQPHSTLTARAELVAVRISTPKEAYEWGLKNITGRQPPRHSDDEMYQMLLDTGQATLKRNVLTFDALDYAPVDTLALDAAARAPYRHGRKVLIKVDSLTRTDLYMKVGEHGRTAHFTATAATLEKLGTLATEEKKLLAPLAKRASKITKTIAHRQRLRDAVAKRDAPQPKGKVKPVQVSGVEKKRLRADVAAAMKRDMNPLHRSFSTSNSTGTPKARSQVALPADSWEEGEAARLQASRDRVRAARKR